MKNIPVSRTMHEDDHGEVTLYEPANQRDYRGGAIVQVNGFAEDTQYNRVFAEYMAAEGARVYSASAHPGQSRRAMLNSIIRNPKFRDSDPDKRVVIPHSAGSMALSGEMSDEEVAMLADEIHTLVLSNVPFDPNISRHVLLLRYVRSAIDRVMRHKSLSVLVEDIGDIRKWCTKGNVFREINTISSNSLPQNLPMLAQHFGKRLKVIVDEKDILCPPQPIRSAINALPNTPKGRPHVIEVSHGHCPTHDTPHLMMNIVRGLQNMPVLLRRLKQKFVLRRHRKTSSKLG